jgi:hypothetical protein
MKLFVSYSFRSENKWVEDYVIPLLECFGHEVITGRILDAGPLDEEVKKKIRQCRRVLCFVTRAAPIYDQNGATGNYHPPDWVRDELMLARGAERDTIEFRESKVQYGGAAPFHAYCEFDRNQLSQLLLDIALRVREWPVGPLQLRLAVPEAFRSEVEQAANAGTLKARCVAIEDAETQYEEELTVRFRDEQLIILFWIKPKPNVSIEIEVNLGARRLVSRGISPAVREARLAPI